MKSKDFCVLILYPATLLNYFITSDRFYVASLVSLYSVSCHLPIVPFYFSLPMGLSFIFFSCLIAAATMSNTMLNRMVRMGILVFFPNLVKKFSAFYHRVLCWQWVCHKWLLFSLYTCSLYIHFGESSYLEWMLNFMKSSLWVYWDDHVFLSFLMLMWYITLVCVCLTILVNLGIVQLIIMFDSFYVLLHSVCNILLRIFAFIFVRDIDLYSSNV